MTFELVFLEWLLVLYKGHHAYYHLDIVKIKNLLTSIEQHELERIILILDSKSLISDDIVFR